MDKCAVWVEGKIVGTFDKVAQSTGKVTPVMQIGSPDWSNAGAMLVQDVKLYDTPVGLFKVGENVRVPVIGKAWKFNNAHGLDLAYYHNTVPKK